MKRSRVEERIETMKKTVFFTFGHLGRISMTTCFYSAGRL